jgi:hypothetical protein
MIAFGIDVCEYVELVYYTVEKTESAMPLRPTIP